MRQAGIIGVGKFLPKKRITNKDMEKLVDTSDEWIRSRIGIEERRFSPKDWALSDLCIPAARRAIKDAGLSGKDIDLIIVGAMTHDYLGIFTGNIIKEKIGAKEAFAIDINIICSGVPTCIDMAASFIETGRYKNVLVVNGEIFSKYKMSRLASVIFGDGAGAIVLGPVKKDKGILASYLKTQMKDSDKLGMLGGGSKYPPTPENLKKGLFTVDLDGPVIYKFAVRSFKDAVTKVAKKAKIKIKDIDFIIPHQANIRIITQGMKDLGLGMEKTYTNVDKYGNIGGGSVSVAMTEAVKKNKIKPGNIVVTVAFGAGLAWGANIMRWCGQKDRIKR